MEEQELKFKKFLSANKLKYTQERKTIFHEIMSTQDHFDAEELLKRLKNKNKTVSRATIYRTLDLLAKLGIIKKVCYGDNASRYWNDIYKNRPGFLVCISCGKIQEFQIPGMEEAIQKVCEESGFQAHNHCMQITGFCQECQKKEEVIMLNEFSVS